MTDAPSPPGTWKHRRRIIYGTLIYCAADVAYLSLWAADTTLRQQVAIALIALAGSTIGAYIFGATWDDNNTRGQR